MLKPLGSRVQARCDRSLATVRHIISSPKVTEFCVGITVRPTGRRLAYARWCRMNDGHLDGFALIEWDQSREDVLAIERYVFERLKNHAKYGWSDETARRHYPSASRYGEQYFYVAWWSPAFLKAYRITESAT